ncbi:MAG TPA: MFS transporter [Acidimicrobiales bacterium]|nr:MFS transporter [Acidimicrobiales bacterium]
MGPHRRLLAVLVAGQVLGGAATAAGIAVATILAKDLLGGDSLAGLAFAGSTFGAAAAAVPLARRTARRGRRSGLTVGYLVGGVGAVLCVVAAEVEWFPILLAGLFLFGAGNAANLLARYAAADLAPPERRARSISIVVFATTVGAVAGPNLLDPSGRLAEAVGLPTLSGPFLVSIACFAVAVLVEWALLRPDPMEVAGLLGAEIEEAPRRSIAESLEVVRAAPGARLGMGVMVTGHAVMVTVMAMTPLHMRGDGHSLRVIGLVISLHIAGMYGLSPLVGVAADRIGRLPVAMAGTATLVVATLLSASGGSHGVLMVALLLLGIGWSLTLISGSALLTDSIAAEERPSVQGVADLAMGVTAGAGGFASGLVVGVLSYEALSLLAAVASIAAGLAVLRRRVLPIPEPAGATTGA